MEELLTIFLMMVESAILALMVRQIMILWNLHPIEEEKSSPLYITKRIDFE